MRVPKKIEDAWLAIRAPYRALMLRNVADVQRTTAALQHERLVGYCQGGPINLLHRPLRDSVRELADVSLFMTAVRRLPRAANLAARVADLLGTPLRSRTGVSRAVRLACASMTPRDGTDITALRNALEHFEDLTIRGQGLGIVA